MMCDERKPAMFGKTLPEVEFEVTPIDGLEQVYLCKECKTFADTPNAGIRRRVRAGLLLRLARLGHITGPFGIDEHFRMIVGKTRAQAIAEMKTEEDEDDDDE